MFQNKFFTNLLDKHPLSTTGENKKREQKKFYWATVVGRKRARRRLF